MKYDLNKSNCTYIASSKYKYKHLDDDMKKSIVNEVLKIGSIKKFYDEIWHNYLTIHISNEMNKPNAWDILKYEIGKDNEPIPVYKWQKEPIIIDNKNMTLELEVLNFIYWLNPKKVKQYSQ